MKKNILNKVLISTFLILSVLNVWKANAWDFDELNNLLNINSFSCESINKDINKYSVYKWKINNLFKILSKKDDKIKKSYFTKIDKITKKYLDIVDKEKQNKLYTIVWYLKCENDNILKTNNTENSNITKKWTFVKDLNNEIELRKEWNISYIYKKDSKHLIVETENKLIDWEKISFSLIKIWSNAYIISKTHTYFSSTWMARSNAEYKWYYNEHNGNGTLKLDSVDSKWSIDIRKNGHFLFFFRWKVLLFKDKLENDETYEDNYKLKTFSPDMDLDFYYFTKNHNDSTWHHNAKNTTWLWAKLNNNFFKLPWTVDSYKMSDDNKKITFKIKDSNVIKEYRYFFATDTLYK